MLSIFIQNVKFLYVIKFVSDREKNKLREVIESEISK